MLHMTGTLAWPGVQIQHLVIASKSLTTTEQHWQPLLVGAGESVVADLESQTRRSALVAYVRSIVPGGLLIR